MIEYKPITLENFKDFLHLIIYKRGGADEAFYKWKYIDNPVQIFPWGFIAYSDEIPCGCIGCLSKIYIDESGNQHPATWFADWYVDPQYRGNNIGLKLIESVLNLSTYAFGITNPLLAQIIAGKAGYNTLPNCLLTKGGLKTKVSNHLIARNRIKQYVKDLLIIFLCRPYKTHDLHIIQTHSGNEIISYFEQPLLARTFLKDSQYFDWLLNMPFKYPREWHLCYILDEKFLICIEENAESKRYLSVYQTSAAIYNNSQYYKYLRLLGTIAKALQAINFESLDIITSLRHDIWLKSLTSVQPLQCSLKPESSIGLKLSIADKESSWLKIKMKQ